MKWYRQVIVGCLMVCMLAMACIAGAVEPVASEPVSGESLSGSDTGIRPMTDQLVINSPISKLGNVWAQEKIYTSYRVWVDNTTKYEMKVTITEPNGNIRVFYVSAGKSKTYPVNGAPAGVYTLSFYAGGNAVSGTVRVRVADMALS